ncbi:unnamed protein product [Protopolystoma xenopodis]|uniref:Uncharacterized protein n=1 Tax=Protopolystoma xenopodis TaxID=117903 RepID=A0A448X148_9PLAT|nr:unnamed protein product [Protopolystoma xenopodis]
MALLSPVVYLLSLVLDRIFGKKGAGYHKRAQLKALTGLHGPQAFDFNNGTNCQAKSDVKPSRFVAKMYLASTRSVVMLSLKASKRMPLVTSTLCLSILFYCYLLNL